MCRRTAVVRVIAPWIARAGLVAALVAASGCGVRPARTVAYRAPVFADGGKAVRFVRIEMEREPRRAAARLARRKPRVRAVRAVVETVPLQDGTPREGAVLWEDRGRLVPRLVSVWQEEEKGRLRIGLCLRYGTGPRTVARRMTLTPDGSRILVEHSAPVPEDECPEQNRADLFQPLVFNDAISSEVFALPPRGTRSASAVVLHDWKHGTLRVLAAAPGAPVGALKPGPGASGEPEIRRGMSGRATPSRWRRRPAAAVNAVLSWAPPSPNPGAGSVAQVIAYRRLHSAWTWLGPEWTREYRGWETWKITGRVLRRRLGGREQRFTAAWRVRFHEPAGPEVVAMGPNARLLSRIGLGEMDGMTPHPDPGKLLEKPGGRLEIRVPPVANNDGAEVGGAGPPVVRLYCANHLLGEVLLKPSARKGDPLRAVIERERFPCGSRYHWLGPLPPGAVFEHRPRFVLAADDAFLLLP